MQQFCLKRDEGAQIEGNNPHSDQYSHPTKVKMAAAICCSSSPRLKWVLLFFREFFFFSFLFFFLLEAVGSRPNLMLRNGRLSANIIRTSAPRDRRPEPVRRFTRSVEKNRTEQKEKNDGNSEKRPRFFFVFIGDRWRAVSLSAAGRSSCEKTVAPPPLRPSSFITRHFLFFLYWVTTTGAGFTSRRFSAKAAALLLRIPSSFAVLEHFKVGFLASQNGS